MADISFDRKYDVDSQNATDMEMFSYLTYQGHIGNKIPGAINNWAAYKTLQLENNWDEKEKDYDKAISITQDMVGIRMNVDIFDEAYDLLRKRGFKNIYGEEIVHTKTSKAAMMVSPTGFHICVIQHLK